MADSHKWSLNRSLSLGDIAVCISLMVAGFSVYATLDKRVTLVETAQVRMESDAKSNALEIKVDVKEVQRAVESLRTDVVRLSSTIDKAAIDVPPRETLRRMPTH